MAGIFAATGQTCMAGSRVLVHDDIYDDFAKALATRASQIRLGDPSDPASEMGTVACRAQYDKVLRYIDIAKAEGAVLAAGGKRPDDPALEKGLFVEPTVFTEVTNDMRIAREEVFGPVASLIRFRDEDDAVRIANDTSFGLAAGVWTRDIALAHRMIKRLRAGDGVDQQLPQGQLRRPVRRLQGERHRPRERHACRERVHRGQVRLDRHRQHHQGPLQPAGLMILGSGTEPGPSPPRKHDRRS